MDKTHTNNIEQELMEAFLLTKTDAEIGMPDIEEELLRVRSLAEKRQQKHISRMRIASVAACFLIILGIGIARYRHLQASENLCIAYVAGERITDETAIMELLDADMSHLLMEEEGIDGQLNDIFNE